MTIVIFICLYYNCHMDLSRFIKKSRHFFCRLLHTSCKLFLVDPLKENDVPHNYMKFQHSGHGLQNHNKN